MRRILMLLTVVAAGVVVVGMVIFDSRLASAQVSTQAAPGTTITVNSNGDGKTTGNCTLREAIEAANTNQKVDECAAGSSTDRDAIHFTLGKRVRITLGSELPTITDPSELTINGRKAKITVSGDNSVQVFFVDSGAKLTLANLRVADGFVTDPLTAGAGLYNDGGTVEVTNSTFSSNAAITNATDDQALSAGGAIANNYGTLTVTNSTFSGNSATAGAATAFKGIGKGGGISNFAGHLTATNSTFSGNGAATSGGGIVNGGAGTLTVTRSTFSGNSAAGSKLGGLGGGIFNEPESTATVTNSTFSGNSAATSGGGIVNDVDGALAVINSTFSGNSAATSGGAIEADSPVMLANTIVARTTQGGNCSGTITDAGNNIEDGTSCGFTTANNSFAATNPLLAASLANNGGPTKTIALLTGSPAIDAIPRFINGCGTQVKTDQRGVSRPQGLGCDIGAFEKIVRHR